MNRTLNTTINRSKNKKNDEFYAQHTLIFSLCGAAPLRETIPHTTSTVTGSLAICMEISDEWEAGMIYLNVKEL